MFGGVLFGSTPFAGVLSVTVVPPTPPAKAKTGFPFGDDLRPPPASRIPIFTRLDLEKQQDEEDLIAITNLFLNLK